MVETPAKRGKYARAGPLGNVIDDALSADFLGHTSVPAPDPQLDSGGPLSVQLDRVALPARPGPGVAPLRDPHRSPSPWPRDRSAPSPDPAQRTRREDSSPGRSTPDHSGHGERDSLPLLRLRPRGHRLGPLPRVRTRVRPRESRDLRIATTRFAGASRHRPRDRPRRGGVRIASLVVGMALRRLASRGVSNDLRNRRGARRGRSAPGGPQPIVVRAHSAPARGHALRLGGALLREREVLPRLAVEPRSAVDEVLRLRWTDRRAPRGVDSWWSSRWRRVRLGSALLRVAKASGASVHRARFSAAEHAHRATDVPAASLRPRAFRGAGDRTSEADAR